MNKLRTGIQIRVAGFLYLLLAITGFYTQYALNQFVSFADSAQWFEYFIRYRTFFSAGILSFYLMNLSWLALAFHLYRCFKQKEKALSSLLLLSVVSGAGIVFIVIILQSSPLYVQALLSHVQLTTAQSFPELAYSLFMIGDKAGLAAFLFYSLWLFPLAALFLKDQSLSLVWRIILFSSLVIAGIGYLADFILFHFSPSSDTMKFTDITFVGEVVIVLWLLIKGQKKQEIAPSE